MNDDSIESDDRIFSSHKNTEDTKNSQVINNTDNLYPDYDLNESANRSVMLQPQQHSFMGQSLSNTKSKRADGSMSVDQQNTKRVVLRHHTTSDTVFNQEMVDRGDFDDTTADFERLINIGDGKKFFVSSGPQVKVIQIDEVMDIEQEHLEQTKALKK